MFSPVTQKYTTATMTPSPSTKGMSLTIKDKKSKAIATKVHIGDPLLLQITGPGNFFEVQIPNTDTTAGPQFS